MSGQGLATVLVVDDDPAVARFVHNVLTRTGQFHVLVEHGGLAALALLNDRPVDLVVLDIGMPGLDGVALFDIIRSHPRTAQVPVLFVTGQPEEVERTQVRERRNTATLAKPFRVEELRVLARALVWPGRSAGEPGPARP